MRRRILRALISSWLTLLVAPAALHAQEPAASPPSDGASDVYDAAIAEGLQHFGAARWQQAYDAFARAHFERPGARTQRGMGMAAFNLGRLAQARGHFEAALDATAQPLSEQQREHVQQLLAQARARTGRYLVRASPGYAELEVDGRSVMERLLLLDLGTHELALHAEGYATLHRTLSVLGGEDEALELALSAEGRQPAPAASMPLGAPPVDAEKPKPLAAPAPVRSQERATALPLGPIVLVLSGAVLAAALVTGRLEQSEESKLDALCPERACQPEDGRRARSLASKIDTLQVTTDVLLLAGLAGVGLGTWLWLAADDGEGLQARARLGKRPGELGVTLTARAAW